MKFHFISSNTPDAIKAKEEYIKSYNQTDPELADMIIPCLLYTSPSPRD